MKNVLFSKRFRFSLCALLLVGSPLLWSQTAAELETLLASPGVNYAQAARFVLEASEAAVFSDPAEAFRFAMEQKWLPKKADQNGTARLDDISLLVMRSFKMKGGLFYRLFKNSHYAYRELVYHEFIQDRSDPKMVVSGERLLFIVGRMLSITQDDIKQHEEAEAQRLAQNAEQQRNAEAEELRLAHLAAQAMEINTLLAERAVANTTVEVTEAGIMLSLSNIQFLAESAVLAETERIKIQEIAGILQSVPGKKIRITGHTALAGNEADQLQLSYDRAQSVAVLLISMGTRESEDILVQGYGAMRPVADNSTPQGMAANRRVEITILED